MPSDLDSGERPERAAAQVCRGEGGDGGVFRCLDEANRDTRENEADREKRDARSAQGETEVGAAEASDAEKKHEQSAPSISPLLGIS